MNRTTWIVIAVIVVLGLGGLIAFTKKDSVNVDALDPTTIILSENGSIGDRVYGKADAKVIVFEYADFQCSGCAVAFDTVNTVKELYKDKVAFVFRNFPLTTMHPNALAASTVAEAAGQQGKFWEMHDLLFANQTAWSGLSASQRDEVFLGYAKQLALNTDTFTQDQSGEVVSEKIKRDRSLGSKLAVSATPTLFIGSTKLDSTTVDGVINSKSDDFMNKIDDALRNAGETPPSRP